MALLSAILKLEQKIICFWGYAGLGKTYIVRNMMQYISERKFFQGGLVYQNLQ